jgi:hypothetical protein
VEYVFPLLLPELLLPLPLDDLLPPPPQPARKARAARRARTPTKRVNLNLFVTRKLLP